MEIRARLDRSERASEEASKEKKNLDRFNFCVGLRF